MNRDEALHRADESRKVGRFQEAELLYRRLIAADARDADAWHGLGLIAAAAGKREAALECIRHSSQLKPEEARYRRDLERLEQPSSPVGDPRDRAESLNNEGITLARAGNTLGALHKFEQAILTYSDYPAAHNNLANIYRRLGRLDEAVLAVAHAVRLAPVDADLRAALGAMLRTAGRFGESSASYREALRLSPKSTELLKLLAESLSLAGRHDEALQTYRSYVKRVPDDFSALNDLGNLLRKMDRPVDAAKRFRQAIESNPQFAPARANLAYLAAEEGRAADAILGYRAADSLEPSAQLKILAATTLPVIYDSHDHLRECRACFTENLNQLHADGIRIDPDRELLPTRFYLAYHGENDRALHESFTRLARETPDLVEEAGPGSRGRRIRVGILSAYLRRHTIGHLNSGWIARLDPDRFERILFTTGAQDELTKEMANGAKIIPLSGDPGLAARRVAAEHLDLLHYAEIGMDPLTQTLALRRLAPHQSAGWGHPVTSGSRAIDSYISAADAEGDDAVNHYSEKLVLPPHLIVRYDWPQISRTRDRASFGLPDKAHLYLCPQTLFKFHPEFDEILRAILDGDPEGLLILISGRSPHWDEILQKRFERTLPGLLERVRFLAPLGRDAFLGLLALGDVMLDPLHFGGGNTSYEALAAGLPIVTLPSPFLRGRLTHSLLKRTGVLSTVAIDPADYVRIALELGRNPEFRIVCSQNLTRKVPELFEDEGAVTFMEQWIEQTVRS